MSALALLKIVLNLFLCFYNLLKVMHATHGDTHEIMGFLQGRAIPHTIIIVDAWPLAAEASETSVKMQDGGTESTDYLDIGEKVLIVHFS
jgi:hypothetical protein